MSEGPQYTGCTDKANWQSALAAVGVFDIVAAVAAILAVIGGAPAIGVIAGFAAAAEIIRKVAEWQLNGKLICLKNVRRRIFEPVFPDPDRLCVLGTVLDFEAVGEGKSGIENIDNDFAINLLLAPMLQSVLLLDSASAIKQTLERSPQGDLIQNPQPPNQPDGSPPNPGPLKRRDDPSLDFGAMPAGFSGYERTMMISAKFPRPLPANVFLNPYGLVGVDPIFKAMGDTAYANFLFKYAGAVMENGRLLTQQEKDAILNRAAVAPLWEPEVNAAFYQAVKDAFDFKTINVPIMHCEFEGSRIRDVYNALDFAHVHCDTSGFWGFLCDVLNFVISLFLGIPKLIAAAVAWANADDGKLSDSYDGKGGPINLNDPLVIRGRWVYDSAHDGYNEIHAVRTVQKTGPAPLYPTEFLAFHEEWCHQLARVPWAPPIPLPGSPPVTGSPPMTPEQRDTWEGQGRDENRWAYHPVIDGCAPRPRQDPDPLH